MAGAGDLDLDVIGSESRSPVSASEVEANVSRPTWSQRCRLRYRPRWFRSKGAVLVLLWNIAAFTMISAYMLFNGNLTLIIVLAAVAIVYCPLAGLFGDVYFGRYRFLRASALIMWIGSIAVALGQTLGQYQFPSAATALHYCVVLPGYVTISVGFFGIQVTSIPFGIDQLPAASTEEIRSLVHWLIWGWFVGLFIGNFGSNWYKCTDNSVAVTLLSLLPAVAASLILCTNYLCKGWLIMEPRCQNPLRNITGVLKYALTHKYPARRSAFTYWEDRIPSRIDLGKSKYGGPFTNEQVEDVKAFFRVIAATVSILAFVIPAVAVGISVDSYHYQHLNYPCFDTFILHAQFFEVLCIPVYEFMVYPLLRNWIPSSLKRTALFGLLTVAVTIYMIILEIVGQRTSGDAVCMFQAEKNSTALPINYFAVDIPVAMLTGFEWVAFDVAAFEFISSQSPYHMMGLLTGSGVLIFNLAIGLGDAVYYGWYYNVEHGALGLSCGTWYYLFTMAIGFVGLVLLIAVGKWYKERERDDIVSEHRFAESYYGRQRVN